MNDSRVVFKPLTLDSFLTPCYAFITSVFEQKSLHATQPNNTLLSFLNSVALNSKDAVSRWFSPLPSSYLQLSAFTLHPGLK